MSRHLERDLDNLRRDLVTLAGAVEEAVLKAVRALQTRDAALAREVIAADDHIDAGENHVEEECLKLLALHQPVAIDLRRVTAVMLINVDLERVADLAEDLAERAIALADLPEGPIPNAFQRMTDLATTMVRQSLDAFVRQDTRLARAVWRQDDEVDRLNDEVIRDLVQNMQGQPELVETGLSWFSATRQLEGIADLAVNVAEETIHLAEGVIARHRPAVIQERE
jgi:phosphate transport system protein